MAAGVRTGFGLGAPLGTVSAPEIWSTGAPPAVAADGGLQLRSPWCCCRYRLTARRATMRHRIRFGAAASDGVSKYFPRGYYYIVFETFWISCAFPEYLFWIVSASICARAAAAVATRTWSLLGSLCLCLSPFLSLSLFCHLLSGLLSGCVCVAICAGPPFLYGEGWGAFRWPSRRPSRRPGNERQRELKTEKGTNREKEREV